MSATRKMWARRLTNMFTSSPKREMSEEDRTDYVWGRNSVIVAAIASIWYFGLPSMPEWLDLTTAHTAVTPSYLASKMKDVENPQCVRTGVQREIDRSNETTKFKVFELKRIITNCKAPVDKQALRDALK